MEWTIFWATFITIFLAEMGDKTQFAAMAASSQSSSTWTTLLAVILALSLAGTIGVLAGKVLGTYIDPKYMRILSGSLFIVLGIWTLIRK
jgi:putative Ca2+/H+ antiporter (TMEM165/GDT1 family)